MLNDKKDWLLAVILGLTIPAVLMSLESLGMKWMVFGMAGFLFLFLMAPIKNKETIILLLFAGSLCVNLDVNFFISYHFIKLNTLSAGFSLGVADVLLILLYALWMQRAIKEPQRIDIRLIGFLALYFLFFMLMAFSIENAQENMLVWYELKKRVMPLFAILYIGMNVRTLDLAKKIVAMIFLGMAASASVGILQYATKKNLGLSIFGEAKELMNQNVVGSTEIIHRVSGLMPHSNIFGMYLAFILPIAFSLAFADIEKRFKYFSFVVSLLGGLALLLTFSRAAITGFLFGMIIFLLIKNRSLFQRHNYKVFLMYGILMAGTLAVFWNKILDRFLASPKKNISYRFLLNESAFKMIDRHPFFGIGLNNFSIQLEFYDTHGVVAYSRFPAHNLYLLIASETGLISLAVFLLLMGVICWIGMSTYHRCKDPLMKNLGLGLVCGILAMSLQGLADFSLVVQPLYLLFFVVCAVVMSARFNMEKAQ